MMVALDYHTDSMQFDPSRWLDERLQKYVLSNPFNFVPFNAGVCAHTILFSEETHVLGAHPKVLGSVSGSR